MCVFIVIIFYTVIKCLRKQFPGSEELGRAFIYVPRYAVIRRSEIYFMTKSYDVGYVCIIVFVPMSSSSKVLLRSRFTAGWLECCLLFRVDNYRRVWRPCPGMSRFLSAIDLMQNT